MAACITKAFILGAKRRMNALRIRKLHVESLNSGTKLHFEAHEEEEAAAVVQLLDDDKFAEAASKGNLLKGRAAAVALGCFHVRNGNEAAAAEFLAAAATSDSSKSAAFNAADRLRTVDALLEVRRVEEAMRIAASAAAATDSFLCAGVEQRIVQHFAERGMQPEAEAFVARLRANHRPIGADVLRALMTAAAAQNDEASFEAHFAALRALEGNSPQSSHVATFNALLRRCVGGAVESEVLAACAATLQQMAAAGVAFNDETFAVLLEKMLRFRNHDQIVATFAHLRSTGTPLGKRIVGRLAKAFSDAQNALGIGLLMDHCAAFKAKVSMATRNVFVDFLLGSGEWHAAFALLDGCSREGVSFNAETFAILLRHSAFHLLIGNCRRILEEMRSARFSHLGPSLNADHHAALLHVFFVVGDARVNPRLLRFVPIATRDGKLRLLNVRSGQAAIDIRVIRRKFGQLFGGDGIGFCATADVYNDVLVGSLRTNRLQEFGVVADDMAAANVAPNALTAFLHIKALLWAHDAAAAERRLAAMLRASTSPPPLLAFGLILHYFCRRADTTRAERIFAAMRCHFLHGVNHVFYGSLLYAYARKRDYANVLATFSRIEEHGMVADAETFNYAMQAHVQLNNAAAAVRLFEGMRDRAVPRNWYTYYLLCETLLTQNDVAYVEETLLPDACLRGNSISAASFDRLCFYHAAANNTPALTAAVLRCIAAEVRLNFSTLGFVSMALRHALQMGATQNALRLLLALATDFSPQNMHVRDMFVFAAEFVEGSRFNASDFSPNQQSHTQQAEEQQLLVKRIALIRDAYNSGALFVGPATSIMSHGYSCA